MTAWARVSIEVNNSTIAAEIEPSMSLVHFLREGAGLTGTLFGCDTSQCGACTVKMDDKTVKSCTVLAVHASGHQITTIEGICGLSETTRLQRAIRDIHALQCGFCTPALAFAADALLKRKPQPSESEVRDALHENLCRCTGRQTIVDAILLAASRLDEASDASPSSVEAV